MSTLLTEAGIDEKDAEKQTPVEIVFVEGDKGAAFPGTLRRQQQNEKRDQQEGNKDEKSGMSSPTPYLSNHLFCLLISCCLCSCVMLNVCVCVCVHAHIKPSPAYSLIFHLQHFYIGIVLK